MARYHVQPQKWIGILQVVSLSEALAGTRRFRSDSAGTVFGVVLAIHVAIAFAVGAESWDDGYITLSFARTFAETGHFALTPISEQVEGATSPLWLLLMAGIYSIGVTSFYWFHFASQLAAGICGAVAAALVFQLIRPAGLRVAWWITLLVFLLGPLRSETGNGMEMSLLCVVVLGIMLLLRADGGRYWGWVAALAALIPWIRLEATGYIVAGVLGIWLFSSARNRRPLVAVIVASITSACLLAVVRHQIFGTYFLTNTMLAKQMAPYSPPFPSAAWWEQQFHGLVLEPVITALPALVVFLILLRTAGQRFWPKFPRLKELAFARNVPWQVSFGLSYGLAFFAFTGIFGANTFTFPGRMGMSALLVLVIAAVYSVSIPDGVNSDGNPPRLRVRSKLAVVGLFIVPFIGVIAYDTIGMTMRVSQLVSDSQQSKVISFSAFRRNGEAMDRVRVALGLPQLTVLITDVGQPALCCQKLKILDLGLLANSELTRTGWDGFPAYLRSHRPDVIQLHSSFTQESGLDEDDFFNDNYIPVFVDPSLLYLRKDLYERLKNRCAFGEAPSHYFFNGGEPLTSQTDELATSSLTVDKEYLESLNLREYCHLHLSP